MKNSIIQQNIPIALKAVEKYLAIKPASEETRPDTVPKEYDGYAASFTASIVISGLLPTLSFYTDIHKSKRGREATEVLRYKTTQALMHIIHPTEEPYAKNALLMYAVEELYGEDALQADVSPGTSVDGVEPNLQETIMNAAIALKLALRNFKQVETQTQND
jgi:CRISPR/Cas system CMR-associated protein Cmr5 small subunit